MSTPGTGPGNHGLNPSLIAATTIVLLAVLGLEVFGGAGPIVAWLKVSAGVGVVIVGLAWLVTSLRRR